MAITTAWAQAYVRDVVLAIRAADWDRFAELHNPDVHYSSPTSECKGVDELIERQKAFLVNFPDWTVRVTNLTVDPRAGLAVYESVATSTDAAPRISAAGDVVAPGDWFELLSANIVEFDELGRAKAIRSYFKRGAPEGQAPTAW